MESMDCTDIRRLLSGLLDDQVTTGERRAAERHLAGCAGCRALLDEHEALDFSLRSMWRESPAYRHVPSSLESGVLDLTTRTVMRERRFRWFGASGWLVAAAAVALAFTAWFTPQPRTPQPERRNNMLAERAGDQQSESPPDTRRASAAPAPPSSSATPVRWEREADAWSGVLSVTEAIAVGTLQSLGGADSGTGAADDAGHHAGDRAADVALEGDASAEGDGNSATIHVLADNADSASGPLRAGDQGALTTVDSDTLFAASLLLGRLGRADVPDAETVDRIRAIAEYDGLIDRLARTADRLPAEHRDLVRAAGDVLAQVVNGDPTLEALEALQALTIQQRLASVLDELSRRIESGEAM